MEQSALIAVFQLGDAIAAADEDTDDCESEEGDEDLEASRQWISHGGVGGAGGVEAWVVFVVVVVLEEDMFLGRELNRRSESGIADGIVERQGDEQGQCEDLETQTGQCESLPGGVLAHGYARQAAPDGLQDQ